MKKKLALITIHWANSYGGMLQALASQTILSKYGEVSIIDYKTNHLKKTMKVIRYGYKPRDYLRMGKDLVRLLPRYKLLNKFENFINTYFNMTKECVSLNDLKSLEKDFDIFICGSDQIWNPKIVDGFNEPYFLGFIDHKKKISFASSAGSHQFSAKEEGLLINYLSSFSAISTREKDTASYIANLLKNDNISTVLDPTLMLSKAEWFSLLDIKGATNEKHPYVFVYTLKKDAFVREIVNKVSSSLNLKVVVIDQDPFLGYSADRHIQDAGPKEYIELLSNASFVITNSFHGTVFSVNFKIPFVSIKPESGLNRMQNFLENVELQDRLILNNEHIDQTISARIDFEKTHEALGNLKKATWSFLDKSLRT